MASGCELAPRLDRGFCKLGGDKTCPRDPSLPGSNLLVAERKLGGVVEAGALGKPVGVWAELDETPVPHLSMPVSLLGPFVKHQGRQLALCAEASATP